MTQWWWWHEFFARAGNRVFPVERKWWCHSSPSDRICIGHLGKDFVSIFLSISHTDTTTLIARFNNNVLHQLIQSRLFIFILIGHAAVWSRDLFHDVLLHHPTESVYGCIVGVWAEKTFGFKDGSMNRWLEKKWQNLICLKHTRKSTSRPNKPTVGDKRQLWGNVDYRVFELL